MKIVKEGFVLFLVDSKLPPDIGVHRPEVNGYFSDRPFYFQKKPFPRCCPVLTQSAKVYHSYNYAYSSGELWMVKCKFVDSFRIEMVGVSDTGEVVLMENVVEKEMQSRTAFIPEEHRDQGLVKMPSNIVGEKGTPHTFPNGETTFLYTRNHIAVAIGRSSDTIRKWEISGVIPDTGFRGKNNVRQYSREQVAIVVKSAERARLSAGRPLKNSHFSRWVHKGFAALKQHHEKYEGGVSNV